MTLDLSGRVRFGPDATYCDSLDYGVDPRKAGVVRARGGAARAVAARGVAAPEQAGIRPRLAAPGGAFCGIS